MERHALIRIGWPRLVCLAAILVATRSWLAPVAAEHAVSDVEGFFYERTDSVWVTLAAATWLAWRRIDRLRALERAPALGAALLVWSLGAVSFVWARLVAADDLMVFALVGLILGAVMQAKGVQAIRVLAPALVVALFSIPLPAPLYNEVVWAAQRAATIGAYEILRSLGYALEMSDMALNHEGHVFWVIETCSGLRAVELLTVSAIVIRDLLGPGHKRLWWLVVAAPPLALAFNVLRIATIVAFQSGQATPEEHVIQGLVSVFAGTVLLFAAGQLMLAATSSRSEVTQGSAESADLGRTAIGSTRGRLLSQAEWIRVVGCSVVLALMSLAIDPWPVRSGERISLDGFGRSQPGWEAERIGSGLAAFGDLPKGEVVVTRFVRSVPEVSDVEAVEFRLVAEAKGTVRESLRASRLDTLGPEWSTERLGDVHLWQVDRQARVSLARRSGIQALSYRWLCSDRNWLGAVLDSALALRRAPWRRVDQPLDVRVTTVVPGDGSDGRRARAQQVLDAFITDVGPMLRSLEADCDPG